MKVDLSFIMCCYNEIDRIEKAYEDVLDSLRSRKESVEILFIDNGSTDGTQEWLKNLINPMVKVIFNEKNLGKGGSIKKGIKLSSGCYVVIHDPDYEYRAVDVWKCYDYAKETKAAFVLGSRLLNGQIRYQYYLNYIGIRFLTFLINKLYRCNLTDTGTAMKLLKGNIVRKVVLECDGFDLDFELVTRISRIREKIVEVPADYYPRTVLEGKKIKPFRDGFLALRVIIRDRFKSKNSMLSI